MFHIYFSSGPHTTEQSCEPESGGACSIFRVTWDLVAEAPAGDVELIVPAGDVVGEASRHGQIEPEVHFTTGALAFIQRTFDGAAEKAGRLIVLDAPVSSASPWRSLDYGTNSADRPQWPAWMRSNLLVYEKADKAASPHDSERTMYSQHADDSLGTSRKARLGVHGAALPDISFGNPRPRNLDLGLPGIHPRIVSFGEDPSVTPGTGGKYRPVPHVHGLTSAEPVEYFDITSTYKSCHHPDWSADGTRIMCTLQDQVQPIDATRDVRPLVHWGWDPVVGKWAAPVGRLSKIDTTALPSAVLGDGPILPGKANWDVLTYKYARWVGSEHVLATVFTSKSDKTVTGSRILLIHQPPSGDPVYFDLTALAHAKFGSPLVPFRGVFASWRPVA